MIVIDRILDGVAVCEADGATMSILLSSIAGSVREGDVLREVGDGRYSVDAEGTEHRRSDLSARFDAIKARKKTF